MTKFRISVNCNIFIDETVEDLKHVLKYRYSLSMKLHCCDEMRGRKSIL